MMLQSHRVHDAFMTVVIMEEYQEDALGYGNVVENPFKESSVYLFIYISIYLSQYK
jgi:hypothetical protein